MARNSFVVLASLATLFATAAFGQENRFPEQAEGPTISTLSVTVGGQLAHMAISADSMGNALYQGDIILGPIDKVLTIPNGTGLMELGEAFLFGLAVRDIRTRWPNGVVSYRIDPGLAAPERVFSAMAAWQAYAGIQFIEASSATQNHIVFTPGDGCSSYIGMIGGPQPILLSDDCGIGNTIHEIGHALGLQHEQAREDRSEHVIVYAENIQPGREGNFAIDPATFADIGDYCFDSIMHYPEFAFSRSPGLRTIETVPPGIPIGQRSYLAECDVDTYKTIYEISSDMVAAKFEGVLELYPENCRADRKCYLRNDITFTDPYGVKWRAGKRDPNAGEGIFTGLTDGATIPGWAQGIVGQPYSEEFLLAAVVHDHYCYDENHVRGWRETHRMFYDALVALNVPSLKAKIMYAAVYIGGPKWTDLVLGEPCGPNCIFDATDDTGGGAAATTIFRAADYASPNFEAMLQGVSAQIELNQEMSLSDIEAEVQSLRPNDFFYKNPGVLDITGR